MKNTPRHLTEDDKDWFGERMSETESGRIVVPEYLIQKYRAITGDNESRDCMIASHLIEACY